jgi:hypothetical protein
MVATTASPAPFEEKKLEKKPIKFSNLMLGAGLNMFEVTTLGQPLEVVKTTMAAHRGDGFGSALGRIWARGGVLGCKRNPFLPFPRPGRLYLMSPRW